MTGSDRISFRNTEPLCHGQHLVHMNPSDRLRNEKYAYPCRAPVRVEHLIDFLSFLPHNVVLVESRYPGLLSACIAHIPDVGPCPTFKVTSLKPDTTSVRFRSYFPLRASTDDIWISLMRNPAYTTLVTQVLTRSPALYSAANATTSYMTLLYPTCTTPRHLLWKRNIRPFKVNHPSSLISCTETQF